MTSLKLSSALALSASLLAISGAQAKTEATAAVADTPASDTTEAAADEADEKA